MATGVKERMELLRSGEMDRDIDFLCQALTVLVEEIMDAEVSARIGTARGERNSERVTQRNGCRSRAWDTRVGTMDFSPFLKPVSSYFLEARSLWYYRSTSSEGSVCTMSPRQL